MFLPFLFVKKVEMVTKKGRKSPEEIGGEFSKHTEVTTEEQKQELLLRLFNILKGKWVLLIV